MANNAFIENEFYPKKLDGYKNVVEGAQAKSLNSYSEQDVKDLARQQVDIDLPSALFNFLVDVFNFAGQAIGGLVVGASGFVLNIIGGLIDGATAFYTGLTRMFGGDGATMEALEGAVDERLGNIDTAISESGKTMTELNGKVETSIVEQERLNDEIRQVNLDVEAAVNHAEELNNQRIAAEALITQKVTEATTAADTAKAAADGKSTNFYGSTAPTTAVAGDTWFKKDANGKITIMQRVKNSDGTLSWQQNFDQNAIDVAIAAKVDGAAYTKKMNDLDGSLGTLKTDLTTANTAIAKKVDTTVYTQKMQTLDTDLGKAKTDVATALTEVAKKVDTTTLNTQLATVNNSIDTARAEALAAGLLTPGNLVYNPKFEQDKNSKILGWVFNTLPVVRNATGGYRDAHISVTYPAVDTSYKQAIYNAYPDHKFMSPAAAGRTFKLTVYVRPKAALPAGALRMGAFGGAYEDSPALPAGVWTKWVTTSKITTDPTTYKGVWFAIFSNTSLPAGSIVDYSEPEMAEAADKWLIIDGSVSMDKLAVNSVDATKIVAGSITAKELGANSVTATQIKADEIKSIALATDSVTAGKIAANAVTATTIASDAVTAEKIKAGSISSNHVMANSINASHVVLAQPGNLIANGDFSSGIEPWTGAITYVAGGGGTPNGKYGNLVTGYESGQFHGTDNWFMVEPGASYAFEIWLYADTAGSVFFMQCFNQDGVGAGKTMNVTVNDGDSLSSGVDSNHLVNGVTVPAGKWTRFSCVYQMDSTTTKARIGNIWFNHGNGVQTGKQALGGVSLRPMADASLIVDGSITAKQIMAGTITGKEIKADSITANELGSNSVTANEVAARSITATHLLITPGNMTYNPTFTNDGEGWNASGATVTWDKNPDTNSGKATVVTGATDAVVSNVTPLKNGAQVAPGQTLRVSMTVTSPTVTTGTQLWCGAYFYDANGAYKATAGYYAGENVPANTSTRISTQIKVPDGCYIALTRLLFKANTGTYTVVNPMMVEATDASLVVEGSITAKSIFSGSVGTDALAANAVKAGNIDSNAIVSRHIQADAITATQVKAELFTQVGSSVLPVLVGSTKGVWTDQAVGTGLDTAIGAGEAGRWYGFTGTRPATKANMVAVDPSIEYDLEVWLYSIDGSSLTVPLLDQNGANAVLSGGINNNAYTTSPVASTVTNADGTTSTVYTTRQNNTANLIGTALPTSWKKYTTRVKLREGVRFIRIGDITSTGTCYMADLQLRVHVVPQAEIDAIQDNAIKGLQISQKNQVAINDEQERINRTVQQQMWIHQDMIELADIRAMKMWGYKADTYEQRIACPWNNNEVHHYWSTAFYEFWRAGDTTYLACKGQWLGKIHMSTNWTGGQIDESITSVEPTSRIFKFVGGARQIDPRRFAITVQVSSLNRKAVFSGNTRSWSDINKLVRFSDNTTNRARMRNAFTATVEVDGATRSSMIQVIGEDGNPVVVNASQPLYGMEIDLSAIKSTDILTVYEFGAPVTEANVSDTRPAGSATEV